MPSMTNVSVEERKRHVKRYTEFRGVDFSSDATQVADYRSPYAENLISDLKGFPEKRPGWQTFREYDGAINGMFIADFSPVAYTMVHAGTKLYRGFSTVVSEDMNNARSFSFAHGGKYYILDGKTYSVLEKTENGVSLSPVADGECFIPTTTIGMAADGSGTSFEAFNLLSKWRKNSMIGDGESMTFHLDTQNLDYDEDVSVTIDGVEKLENTDFVVDRTAGTITFNTAPPVYAGGSGIDNIIVTFAKTVEGAVDKINKCTMGVLYGYGGANRYFFSGNPDEKNVDWYSGLDDPTYFPDIGYTKIGSDATAIMGYLKQYENLIIVKESNEQDAEIFLRSAQMDSEGNTIFPVKQGAKGVGAISRYAFATLRDDPLFLSRNGVQAIASASVTQQRAIQPRSYFVNEKLTKEPNLKEAVACVWNNWYVLCVNSNCYVADARQKSYQDESYTYEWYYWTNVPARVMLADEDSLIFGTADGKLCEILPPSDDSTYNDDGEPITAVWSTKADDFGSFGSRKTLVKRGSAVMLKPYTRSSVEVYVTTDKISERLIRTGRMDIFDFSDIDFTRFVFDTSESSQVIPFNKKVKKFITLQLIFKNAEKNERFGIYGTEVTYVDGNYVK